MLAAETGKIYFPDLVSESILNDIWYYVFHLIHRVCYQIVKCKSSDSPLCYYTVKLMWTLLALWSLAVFKNKYLNMLCCPVLCCTGRESVDFLLLLLGNWKLCRIKILLNSVFMHSDLLEAENTCVAIWQHLLPTYRFVCITYLRYFFGEGEFPIK